MAVKKPAKKKTVQPAGKGKSAKVSDKALPAKKATSVKGGAVKKTGIDPLL